MDNGRVKRDFLDMHHDALEIAFDLLVSLGLTLTFDHLTSKIYCCVRLTYSPSLKFVWL